ncbi:redoxin family protein [Chitinophaga lutea]
MKKIFILAGAIAAGLSASAQQGYTINVTMKGQGNYKMNLLYMKDGSRVWDSLTPLGGDKFRISGQVKEPLVAYLTTSHPSGKHEVVKGGMFMPGPSLELILSNADIQITGDAEKVYLSRVSGDPLNKELAAFKKKENPLVDKNWEMSKKAMSLRRTDTAAAAAATREAKAAQADRLALRKDYIATHPGSFISMYLLSMLHEDYTPEAYQEAYAKLGSQYKTSVYGKMVSERIESTKATALGKQAIPFTKKDINGQPFSLASLKGKVVLLDFWGSWCGPCRSSHPHLKGVYEKYKGKGLEIVGIAEEKSADLSQNEAAWKKAVADDGIAWVHVMNNYNKEELNLVQKYGVTGFPTKYLLDRDGKIVYKLVGSGPESDVELDAHLKRLLGE